MNNYELTIVLPGDATPAKKKQVIAKIEKHISGLKGKVGKVDDWGKIDMAYKIDGNETGLYMLFPIELEPAAAKELGARLKAEEGLIRYLLVKADKKKIKK